MSTPPASKVLFIIDRIVFGGQSVKFWKKAVFIPVGIGDVQVYPLYGVGQLGEHELKYHRDRLGARILKYLT